jgi:GMP synthase-like glutamine amidotransferase
MAVPDVVVWEADGKPLPWLGYGARLAAPLRALGARVRVVPYRRRPLTPVELAAPVHLLSGGETTSFAGDPATVRALADLTDLLRRAWQGEATVLGVCLGAQLVARGIAPGLPQSFPERGLEAGMCTVYGPGGPLRVAELHYEDIHPSFAEVGGVQVTHTNGHTRVQGFRWGETVAGYQFHPEWTPRDAGAVLDRHLTLLATRHADPASARASVTDGASTWSERTAWELLVAPAVRALGLRGAQAA